MEAPTHGLLSRDMLELRVILHDKYTRVEGACCASLLHIIEYTREQTKEYCFGRLIFNREGFGIYFKVKQGDELEV